MLYTLLWLRMWFDLRLHWIFSSWWLLEVSLWMMVIAYPNMVLLHFLPLFEGLDLDFGFSLFSLGVRLLWFFDVPCHLDDALFILPCVFVPFMSILNDRSEILAMQGSREMVDGEEVLDRGHLGRLTESSLSTHLTWELKFWVHGFILQGTLLGGFKVELYGGLGWPCDPSGLEENQNWRLTIFGFGSCMMINDFKHIYSCSMFHDFFPGWRLTSGFWAMDCDEAFETIAYGLRKEWDEFYFW